MTMQRQMTPDEVLSLLEKGLDGAKIDILDPQNDGVHLGARIVWDGFEGKNRLARHRAVYTALGDAFEGPLHALQMTLIAPSETK